MEGNAEDEGEKEEVAAVVEGVEEVWGLCRWEGVGEELLDGYRWGGDGGGFRVQYW